MGETQEKIGKLILGEEQRDAIHVAVAPVVAAQNLSPGQAIGFVNGSTKEVGPQGRSAVGIVDPFLRHVVKRGERFWLFLYPNTITTLRHHWIHPAFAEADAAATITADDHKAKSEAWLREFAETLGLSRNALMAAAERWVEYEDYTVQRDSQQWRDEFQGHEKDFWHHYEIVTGKKVEDHEASFFCCSC